MRQFNTNAVCIPSKHYMVDLSSVTDAIKKLVDAEKYFSINRARQYGKTTTLNALEKSLSIFPMRTHLQRDWPEYCAIQGIS